MSQYEDFISIMIFICSFFLYFTDIDSSVGKESCCNEGDMGSIPGLGRSPGEGKGNFYIFMIFIFSSFITMKTFPNPSSDTNRTTAT